MSGSSTSTVLQNLDPGTEYTVAVVPVYPEMEGISQSEKGKTSELSTDTQSPAAPHPSSRIRGDSNRCPLLQILWAG